MIFIDYSKYRPSKKWRKAAKKQLNIISTYNATGQVQARNTHIDNRSYLWSNIKQQIIRSTYNKCWFSEGTSDVAHFQIEHFRPKKCVELLPAKHAYSEARVANTNDCYWWLAFSFKNYRICGAVINPYKGNYFPLKTGSYVSNAYNSNLLLEEGVLLDPTVEDDTKLLTYDINGTPIPSSNILTNPYEYKRAEISINVYGLKDSLIVDSRERKLSDLNILIDKIDRYYNMYSADTANEALLTVVKEECSWLLSMAGKAQPFSKMVKCRIEHIPYKWAIDYVIPYLL